MEFNNEMLRLSMREAIKKELDGRAIALDDAALNQITQAAYNAVMQFFVVGAIATARKNQGKEM